MIRRRYQDHRLSMKRLHHQIRSDDHAAATRECSEFHSRAKYVPEHDDGAANLFYPHFHVWMLTPELDQPMWEVVRSEGSPRSHHNQAPALPFQISNPRLERCR